MLSVPVHRKSFEVFAEFVKNARRAKSLSKVRIVVVTGINATISLSVRPVLNHYTRYTAYKYQ